LIIVEQTGHSKVSVSNDGRAGFGFDLTKSISTSQLSQIGRWPDFGGIIMGHVL
jgi:hypothetical protein